MDPEVYEGRNVVAKDVDTKMRFFASAMQVAVSASESAAYSDVQVSFRYPYLGSITTTPPPPLGTTNMLDYAPVKQSFIAMIEDLTVHQDRLGYIGAVSLPQSDTYVEKEQTNEICQGFVLREDHSIHHTGAKLKKKYGERSGSFLSLQHAEGTDGDADNEKDESSENDSELEVWPSERALAYRFSASNVCSLFCLRGAMKIKGLL